MTDLSAEQASTEELATWAREHWTVLAAVRDLIRGTLRAAGYANTAANTDTPSTT